MPLFPKSSLKEPSEKSTHLTRCNGNLLKSDSNNDPREVPRKLDSIDYTPVLLKGDLEKDGKTRKAKTPLSYNI